MVGGGRPQRKDKEIKEEIRQQLKSELADLRKEM